jgi:hypothetical protein
MRRWLRLQKGRRQLDVPAEHVHPRLQQRRAVQEGAAHMDVRPAQETPHTTQQESAAWPQGFLDAERGRHAEQGL